MPISNCQYAAGLCEVGHGLMVPPWRGKQQQLGQKVVHHGDVVLHFFDAGLVDADVAHLAHVVIGSHQFNVMTVGTGEVGRTSV